MIHPLKKLKKFIKASNENRTEFVILLGFFVIPVIGLTILYIIMYFFVIH